MQVGKRGRGGDRRYWLNTTLVVGLAGINIWLLAGLILDAARQVPIDVTELTMVALSCLFALALAGSGRHRSPIQRHRMASVPALRQTLATHQAGHLIAAYVADPNRLRTTALAGECRDHDSRAPALTESAMRSEMKVSLGGIVAEEIFAGETSSYASGDLARATSIAAAMVGRYGMAGSPVSMEPAAHNERTFVKRVFDDARARKDLEVLLREAKQDAVRSILEKRHAVIDLSDALLRHSRLRPEEIRTIIARAEHHRREHNEVLVDLRVVNGSKSAAEGGH